MRTGLVELREIDITRLVHPGIVQLERQPPIKIMAHADVNAPDIDTVLVPVKRTLLPLIVVVDGGDTLVEDVTIAHEGEVIDTIQDATMTDAVLTLEGDIEVMALLGFKVWISDDPITHATHIEMHIHLLERGRTETAGIVGAEGKDREFIHHGETSREGLQRRGREVIVAGAAHDVELIGDVPVELDIAVDIVLRVAGIIDKLIGGEVVVQVVGAKEQVVLTKGMVVERMHHMLLIAVVVIMRTRAVRHEISLVVLVVGVRQFKMTGMIPGIATFQSCTVGIEMIVVGVALASTEEIAATADKCQLVCGAPRQPFLHVIGRLSVEAAQVRIVVKHRLVVGQALCLLHQFKGDFL